MSFHVRAESVQVDELVMKRHIDRDHAFDEWEPSGQVEGRTERACDGEAASPHQIGLGQRNATHGGPDPVGDVARRRDDYLRAPWGRNVEPMESRRRTRRPEEDRDGW